MANIYRVRRYTEMSEVFEVEAEDPDHAEDLVAHGLVDLSDYDQDVIYNTVQLGLEEILETRFGYDENGNYSKLVKKLMKAAQQN